MPTQSQQQQKLMGLVHAIQKGDAPASGEAGELAKSMKPGDVKDFASTSRKDLPKYAEEQGDPTQMAAEAISKYNEYGQHFKSAMSMGELAEKLMQVAEFAEQSVMSEAEDWFDGHTIKRNMKEMKSYVGEFAKVAREHDSLRQRMSALYDDMGRVLERYFEIHEGDVEDNLGPQATNKIQYDTGEDEIEIGNSNKNPVPPAHAAQMAHEDDNTEDNQRGNGQVSDTGGYIQGGEENAGEPHNMDDLNAIADTERNQDVDAKRRQQDEDQDKNQYPSERDSSALEMDETASLKRAKNLTERMVRLAREQLKGEQLIRFDTLPREIQIRAAWKLIR